MAFRFKLGKPNLKRIRLPQMGVRGSLFAAFAVIAGMALVISAGAGIVLHQLGGTMSDLSGRDIPRLAASLQLAAQSASLAAQGPGLLAVQSDDALNERTKKVQEVAQQTNAKLGEIIELGADKSVVSALQENVKNTDEATKSLISAAHERLEIGALRDKQYNALRKAQGAFVSAAGPAMLDAQTRLNAILGSADVSADDATEAARTVGQISNVLAAGNLMAADMTAALSANSSETIDAIEAEFKKGRERDQVQPRRSAEQSGDRRRARHRAEAAGARRRQDRRVQDPPEGARLDRLRPDHPGGDPQAQCRARHQRAAAGRRRAEGDRRVDLPGAAADLAGDHWS